ncbi:aminoglycoside adenylyltransferase family protein [Streptomonospora salina]|uniref:Streptomycin 3'-adenylyltransferase n=1 Tax=Streptomonospora salina TaxID=104205 RepID=A0A841EIG7_9ACTN|nr:aminoglycoside adenylyltransferase family protein [Streptomonospora salina]MBB6000608.1 streptomycin 3'-adenylyltransferase [Streptomonospora salina]
MDLTDDITRLVCGVLGPDTLGVYLHGSAVSGGLKPASDLDVLVVSRRSMDDGRRRLLLDGLLARSGLSGGARPVELTVVVQFRIRPWRFPPTGDFLYGEWMRDELTAGGPPRPATMPDLALVITMALAGDRPLAGPPPARILAPVPHEDVVRASVASLPELLAEAGTDTRNVVLTLARIWTTLATGEIMTKDAAAEWALARLPEQHRPVLSHARDLYLHRRYAEEVWSEELKADAQPHLEAVLAEIDRLAHR